MSDDGIIPFRAKPPETAAPVIERYLEGKAICGACQHEWDASVPVGETRLECPACHRFWGAFKHMVEPLHSIWRCGCGEAMFWLTRAGAMCRRCGLISSQWAD